jgi:hypothetical protein
MLKVTTNVIGATGTVSSFRTYEYLDSVTGKQELKEIQKKPFWALHTYLGKY